MSVYAEQNKARVSTGTSDSRCVVNKTTDLLSVEEEVLEKLIGVLGEDHQSDARKVVGEKSVQVRKRRCDDVDSHRAVSA